MYVRPAARARTHRVDVEAELAAAKRSRLPSSFALLRQQGFEVWMEVRALWPWGIRCGEPGGLHVAAGAEGPMHQLM
jgi:hypothetical protein